MENIIGWVVAIGGIIACILGIHLLSKFPGEMISKMEYEATKQIKARDEKYEKEQEVNHVIKKWLF